MEGRHLLDRELALCAVAASRRVDGQPSQRGVEQRRVALLTQQVDRTRRQRQVLLAGRAMVQAARLDQQPRLDAGRYPRIAIARQLGNLVQRAPAVAQALRAMATAAEQPRQGQGQVGMQDRIGVRGPVERGPPVVQVGQEAPAPLLRRLLPFERQ